MSKPLTPAEADEYSSLLKWLADPATFTPFQRERLHYLGRRLLDERDALEQSAIKLKDAIEWRENAIAKTMQERDTIRAQLEARTETLHDLQESVSNGRSDGGDNQEYIDIVADLRARCEQLERDRERLDWLERNHHHHNGQVRFEVGELSVYRVHPTIRESIDAALGRANLEPSAKVK